MGKIFSPKRFNLKENGIEKVLGELEAKIMEIVWESGCSTARRIRDRLAQQKRDLSFNSIMTVLNRLVDKRVLKKDTKDRVYTFTPELSRDDFSRLVARDIIASVVKDPTLFSVASFHELAQDLDAETLAKLKAFLKQEKT